MEDRILVKTNIKANLTYGSLSKIAREVYKKTGKTVSAQHVKNVCDPEKSSWDADVISEAQNMIILQKGEVSNALEKII